MLPQVAGAQPPPPPAKEEHLFASLQSSVSHLIVTAAHVTGLCKSDLPGERAPRVPQLQCSSAPPCTKICTRSSSCLFLPSCFYLHLSSLLTFFFLSACFFLIFFFFLLCFCLPSSVFFPPSSSSFSFAKMQVRYVCACCSSRCLPLARCWQTRDHDEIR